MTIASVRIYFYPRSRSRERSLTASHWGFAEWFTRRLKPIRDQLRGAEVKGVNIMNLMLYERPEHAWKRDEWIKRGNMLQFAFVCDLKPLSQHPPLENIERLMNFYAQLALAAPWPQARAVGRALAEPLTDIDRITLAPYLQCPRASPISDARARRMAQCLTLR